MYYSFFFPPCHLPWDSTLLAEKNNAISAVTQSFNLRNKNPGFPPLGQGQVPPLQSHPSTPLPPVELAPAVCHHRYLERAILPRFLYFRPPTALRASELGPYLKSSPLLGTLLIPALTRTDQTLPWRGCSPHSLFRKLAHIYLSQFRLFSKTKVWMEIVFCVTAYLFLACVQQVDKSLKTKTS